MRAADLPAGSPLFPQAAGWDDWVEVGFGDRLFYPTPDPPLVLALRAAFWPSPGVLAVAAHRGPAAAIPGAELFELRVPAEAIARLHARILAPLERDGEGRLQLVAIGPSGTTRFYASRERFHLFRTCNVWTGALLAEAGVPVAPALTAGELLARLEPFARRLRRRRWRR